MPLPILTRLLAYSALITVLTSGVLFAQDSASVWLGVTSNLPSSLVLVDSAYAGRADGTLLKVPARSRSVVLVPTVVGAWDLPQPRRDLLVAPGDTLYLDMDFPYQYRIDSVPFGAVVSIPGDDGQMLGTTPLVHSSEEPLRRILLLQKQGYANAEVEPGLEVVNRHSIVLQPITVDAIAEEGVEWSPRSTKHTWINWAAAGVVLTGGALAVHFKFKADDEYDRYLQNGDPDLKERVDRFDRYSYIALGAMQVGIGVLAIRLAF